MKDNHLPPDLLEALAHGRLDLVDDASRAHASMCEACTQQLQATWMQSQGLSAVMREKPELDFDVAELARAAVATHASTLPLRTFVLGTLSALAFLLVVVVRRVMSGGTEELRTVGEHTWVSAAAIDSLVQNNVPLGWSLVAILASTAALLASAALWRGMRVSGRIGAAATIAFAMLIGTPSGKAAALDFTGEWPENETSHLDVDNVTCAEALRVAARTASLDLVDRAPTEERVSVHVRNATTRTIFSAILEGRDVTVNRTGQLVTIRATVIAAPEPTASPAVVPAVAPQPAPSAQTPRTDVGERAAFGSSVLVSAGETVKSAIVFGGNVDVHGHVLEDAVAFGGNVTLHCGSIVDGDTVAFGGHVVRESPCTNAPAPVANTPSTTHAPPNRHASHSASSDGSSWFEDFLSDAASLALVFIVGLVLMRWAPGRFQLTQSHLQAHPFRSFGLGVLAIFAVTLLALALTITIIGIPVALFVILAAMFAGYAGAGLIAMLLGRALPFAALREKPVVEFAVGLVLVLILLQLPGLGAALFACACVAAFGAVAGTRLGTRQFA